MPELPEVETIRRTLIQKIVGKKILNIEVLTPKSFQDNPFHARGKKVLNITRKAKVLGIDLAGDLTLLFHLKMSGQVIFHGSENFSLGHPTIDWMGEMPNKSTRIIFEFDDGSKIFFNDQRKFGWVKLVKSDQLHAMNYGYSQKIGPEPLEENFSWEVLKSNLLKHRKTAVKVALLDQTVVAGVGNIYANEACFLAGIDPRVKVFELSEAQIKRLHQGVIDSLNQGIKYGGSSKTHFVDPEGKKGLFLEFASVYGRDKKPCTRCGTEIKRIKLGGRGTFFCTSCQKEGVSR